jgi:hypothetical protein
VILFYLAQRLCVARRLRHSINHVDRAGSSLEGLGFETKPTVYHPKKLAFRMVCARMLYLHREHPPHFKNAGGLDPGTKVPLKGPRQREPGGRFATPKGASPLLLLPVTYTLRFVYVHYTLKHVVQIVRNELNYLVTVTVCNTRGTVHPHRHRPTHRAARPGQTTSQAPARPLSLEAAAPAAASVGENVPQTRHTQSTVNR